MLLAISRLVRPCQTKVATCVSLPVNSSQGCTRFSFRIHRSGELYAFAPVGDSCAQKQCAQMLLHRSRADVELFCDFLVAASLHQQVENLFISASNLNAGNIHHSFSSVGAVLQAATPCCSAES